MPVYHIALFKAKPTTGSKELDHFHQAGKVMLGKVPGLLAVEFGKALDMLKAHGHGFDLGAVVTLSKPEDFRVYADHPLHHELMKLSAEFFEEDTLLLDFEF